MMLRSPIQQQLQRCPQGIVAPLAIRAAPSKSCQAKQQRLVAMRAEPELQAPVQDSESETERKRLEAERLRAAEKFMVVGAGTATCMGCGYEYKPENGDPDFPIPRGMRFEQLPEEYVCPVCGAGKPRFEQQVKVVAGFAENQRYGLGTNSMTGDQKLALIYGSLLLFFVLFLGGYALE